LIKNAESSIFRPLRQQRGTGLDQRRFIVMLQTSYHNIGNDIILFYTANSIELTLFNAKRSLHMVGDRFGMLGQRKLLISKKSLLFNYYLTFLNRLFIASCYNQ
jgi:hypothetical protein